jgi:hypothetical protein
MLDFGSASGAGASPEGAGPAENAHDEGEDVEVPANSNREELQQLIQEINSLSQPLASIAKQGHLSIISRGDPRSLPVRQT